MGESIKPTCQWINCPERAASRVTFNLRIFDVGLPETAASTRKARTRSLCSRHIQQIRDSYVHVSIQALDGLPIMITRHDRKNRRYKFYFSRVQMDEQEMIDRRSRLKKLPVMRALLDNGNIVDYSEATHLNEPNGHASKWNDSVFLGEGIPIRTSPTNPAELTDPKSISDLS